MRNITIYFFFSLLALSFRADVLQADISLAKIFSDHMVLQRNSTVKVWGTADPGDKLVLKFNDTTTNPTVDPGGRWSTVIKTPDAGGPYVLEVSTEAGEPKIVINDVMVGEVWICSGQSNMNWPVSKSLNADTEIEMAKAYPEIRLFTVEPYASASPTSDFNKTSPWDCCSQESVRGFSATAYFFARELSKRLDMPIGLIHVSWGGTRCEAWTSRPAMDAVEELAPLLRQWDENDDPTSRHRPSNLYNGMIAPLTGFSFRGVIWYQGEANVGRGWQYGTLFPTMIDNWRKDLGKGKKFPFYFVQLAPFRYNGKSPQALPEVWDAQLKTFNQVENTGIVVTTDIGDPADIHPKNKQEVGRRLALWALKSTYDSELDEEKKVKQCSGPIYESISTNANQIRVTFKHAEGGLVARNDAELTHFSICGEDKVFHPAQAAIDGESVIVSSDKVEKPIAVRFGWDDTASPNLFNKDFLPASPFRSDDFELESKDVAY